MNTTLETNRTAYDLQILQGLRGLIHSVDKYSKKLIKEHRISGPQLMCLNQLIEHDGLTVSQLAKAIYLSASTVVSILDRLERQGLVQRIRSTDDRRKVMLHVTQEGRELAQKAPLPLQDALQKGITHLSAQRQKSIAEAMNELTQLLHLEQNKNISISEIVDLHSTDAHSQSTTQSIPTI